MALIKCKECNKDVSSEAPACPNCGMPICSNLTEVSTTASSKNFKTVGAALCCIGVVFSIANVSTLGSLMIFIGFCVFIAGRLKDG